MQITKLLVFSVITYENEMLSIKATDRQDIFKMCVYGELGVSHYH